MKTLLKYVEPSLHEAFIEEYNSLHPNPIHLSPEELKELVFNEVAVAFGISKDKLMGNGKRSRTIVSLACICANHFLMKLEMSNNWIGEKMRVNRTIVSYRNTEYLKNKETNKMFRDCSHQVGFNLSTKYPSVKWL